MEKSLDTCNSRILLIALNILQKQHTKNNELYSDLWKLNERTREACHPEKAASKLCFSSQQGKPLTVKKIYLLLSTWWRTLIWNQFQKSNCNKGRQTCHLSSGDFTTEVRWWGDLRFWWKFRYQVNLVQFFLSLSVTFTSMIPREASHPRSEIISFSKFILLEKCSWTYVDRCLVPVRCFPSPSRSIHSAWITRPETLWPCEIQAMRNNDA